MKTETVTTYPESLLDKHEAAKWLGVSVSWLEKKVVEAGKKFGDDPPLPPHWGGFRVEPDEFEFWQGRESRLHDRLRYRPDETGWVVERLSP